LVVWREVCYICNRNKAKQFGMKNISKVNILAAQIRRATSATRSQSMRQAWAIIRATADASVLTFTKVKTGEICTRVVSPSWASFQAPVGGRSTNKEGQVLFADLCKHAAGVNCIISTYTHNIVALAA